MIRFFIARDFQFYRHLHFPKFYNVTPRDHIEAAMPTGYSIRLPRVSNLKLLPMEANYIALKCIAASV